MQRISGFLWLVPLSVHMGYILATYSHLPEALGSSSEVETSTIYFLLGWFAVLGAANISLYFIQLRLPYFGDKMLSVPGRDYWLSTPELRNELVEKLRGICETSLLCLNVFFLAVYQGIYQFNAINPSITFPVFPLVVFFMFGPLLLTAGYMIVATFRMALEARRHRRQNNSS
jgi:hypothetical protein